MDRADTIYDLVSSKIAQYGVSVVGGLVAAIESSIPFFIPCLLATVLDVVSAYGLGRRLKRKYPDRADGKFKSKYKFRIMHTMIIAFVVVILAAYVDMLALGGGNKAVCWAFGFFLFYQGWSILENWSSENDDKRAKVLQRIMVNKAERYIDVPLRDIMLKESKDKKDGKREANEQRAQE